jgi:hypothetical protein
MHRPSSHEAQSIDALAAELNAKEFIVVTEEFETPDGELRQARPSSAAAPSARSGRIAKDAGRSGTPGERRPRPPQR